GQWLPPTICKFPHATPVSFFTPPLTMVVQCRGPGHQNVCASFPPHPCRKRLCGSSRIPATVPPAANQGLHLAAVPDLQGPIRPRLSCRGVYYLAPGYIITVILYKF